MTGHTNPPNRSDELAALAALWVRKKAAQARVLDYRQSVQFDSEAIMATLSRLQREALASYRTYAAYAKFAEDLFRAHIHATTPQRTRRRQRKDRSR